MLALLLPMVLWAALGLLVTRRIVAGGGTGATRWAFLGAGPLIGAVYAYHVLAGDGTGDGLEGWLMGLGFAGLILALGVAQQGRALARIDPARRVPLEIGMTWMASTAGGLLGCVLAAALLLAFGDFGP